jgi:hypothetical protein
MGCYGDGGLDPPIQEALPHRWERQMAMNFSGTNAAFDQMLRKADGRYDLVERALVDATRENQGRAPRLEVVLQKISELVRALHNGVAA